MPTLRHNFNPIPVPNPDGLFSAEDLEKIKLHKQYQQRRLSQFTITELQDLDCWDKLDALPTDFDKNVPIHPIYQVGNWRRRTLSIGDTYPGLWDIRRKPVRDTLMPSLRLASLFLVNSGIWLWYEISCLRSSLC